MSTTQAQLPSGREVGIAGIGDPLADRIVLLCHPTPGAVDFDPDPLVTERWGVHGIGLDRPGYGGSAPLPEGEEQTLGARAAEVVECLRVDEQDADSISHADLGTVGVVGWGTGAVVAAVLAADRSGFVDRLVLVSPPSPTTATALADEAVTAASGQAALRVADDDPAFDRHLGLDRRLDRMLEAAALHGTAGVLADRDLFADPAWGEGMDRIGAEVLIIVGEHDAITSDDDLAWWRERIPSATVHVVPDSAALAIADGWTEALDHLAPKHGGIPAAYRDTTPLRPHIAREHLD